MQRVNYNAIAELFDEPLRDHDVDGNLIAFIGEHSGNSSAETRILDIGCGTGKQLAANRSRFPDMPMVGLDLFDGMLKVARRRCLSIEWIAGDGAALPFQPEGFDYICNQFSYPHVREKEKMIHEAFRVLKSGGRFVLTNIDPWAMPDWIVYQCFPAARDMDHRDFLPVDSLSALLQESGFVQVRIRRERRVIREELRGFLQYASQRHRASQFMAISDNDYNAGIRRLGKIIAEGREIAVDSEFCLVTMIGDKPAMEAG